MLLPVQYITVQNRGLQHQLYTPNISEQRTRQMTHGIISHISPLLPCLAGHGAGLITSVAHVA